MSTIKHHIPDHLLAAYASFSLPEAFALVAASHISMCPLCRAGLEAHHVAGGILLDGISAENLSSTLKSDVMSRLDQPFHPEPVYERRGIFPDQPPLRPKWAELAEHRRITKGVQPRFD